MAISSSGFCLCGCGERTELWTSTNRTQGRIVGQHRAFVRGHERPIAPDGLAVRYQDTKWCRRCSRRLPTSDFSGIYPKQAALCRRCAGEYCRERYHADPVTRATRIRNDRKCRQRKRQREQRQTWRATLAPEQHARLERLERLSDIRDQRDPQAKADDDLRESRDPLCLRLGDTLGNALIDQVVEYHGTASAFEELIGISTGALNRYRQERFMTLDVIDKMLTAIGEPYRLDEFEFRRRSEWTKLFGPTEQSVRQARQRRERKQKVSSPPSS